MVPLNGLPKVAKGFSKLRSFKDLGFASISPWFWDPWDPIVGSLDFSWINGRVVGLDRITTLTRKKRRWTDSTRKFFRVNMPCVGGTVLVHSGINDHTSVLLENGGPRIEERCISFLNMGIFQPAMLVYWRVVEDDSQTACFWSPKSWAAALHGKCKESYYLEDQKWPSQSFSLYLILFFLTMF